MLSYFERSSGSENTPPATDEDSTGSTGESYSSDDDASEDQRRFVSTHKHPFFDMNGQRMATMVGSVSGSDFESTDEEEESETENYIGNDTLLYNKKGICTKWSTQKQSKKDNWEAKENELLKNVDFRRLEIPKEESAFSPDDAYLIMLVDMAFESLHIHEVPDNLKFPSPMRSIFRKHIKSVLGQQLVSQPLNRNAPGKSELASSKVELSAFRFLKENKESIKSSPRVKDLTLRIAKACALGGRSKYTKLNLDEIDLSYDLELAIVHGKLNVRLFCIIGHYLLKYGSEHPEMPWYSLRKTILNIGGVHIWSKRKMGNISPEKWLVLRQYSKVKYNEDLAALVCDVFQLR